MEESCLLLEHDARLTRANVGSALLPIPVKISPSVTSADVTSSRCRHLSVQLEKHKFDVMYARYSLCKNDGKAYNIGGNMTRENY